MSKRIRFNVPSETGIRQVDGHIVRLMLGNRRHKFVLQYDITRPTLLTDYRTGYGIANLAGKVLARHLQNGGYINIETVTYIRGIAQEYVDDLAAQIGVETFKQKLAEPPTING